MNVDGVELSAANGYQVRDLEVRNKDSIQVFVEMTSPFNNAATPQEVVDIFCLRSKVVYNRRLTCLLTAGMRS